MKTFENIKEHVKEHPIIFTSKLISWFLFAIIVFMVTYNYEEQQHTEIGENIENLEAKTFDIKKIEIDKIENVLIGFFKNKGVYDVCFRDNNSQITTDAFGGVKLRLSVRYHKKTTDLGTISRYTNAIKEVCFKHRKNIDGITIGFEVGEKNQVFLNEGEKMFSSFNQDGLRDSFFKMKIVQYFRKRPNNLYHSLLSLLFSGIFLWSLTRIWKFLFYWGVGKEK